MCFRTKYFNHVNFLFVKQSFDYNFHCETLFIFKLNGFNIILNGLLYYLLHREWHLPHQKLQLVCNGASWPWTRASGSRRWWACRPCCTSRSSASVRWRPEWKSDKSIEQHNNLWKYFTRKLSVAVSWVRVSSNILDGFQSHAMIENLQKNV